MNLIDMHVHTSDSPDADIHAWRLVQKDIENNLGAIGFVAHFDLNPEDFCYGSFNAEGYNESITLARNEAEGRISVSKGLEVGEPRETYRFFGYRITRSDAGNSTVLEFLDEYGNTVVMPFGIARIQVENEGQGWHIRTQYDENDIHIAISPESLVYITRYLVDSQYNQLAIENTDNSGELLPLYGDVYRIERTFDSNGHATEVKRLNADEQIVDDPGTPEWQTYQISSNGLTTGFSIFDSDGAPSIDLYGSHSSVFEYDQYGRMKFMKD